MYAYFLIAISAATMDSALCCTNSSLILDDHLLVVGTTVELCSVREMYSESLTLLLNGPEPVLHPKKIERHKKQQGLRIIQHHTHQENKKYDIRGK